MSTVIFVHGTGVREPSFSMLFGRVRSELQRRRPELDVEPCYWGGSRGRSALAWRRFRSGVRHHPGHCPRGPGRGTRSLGAALPGSPSGSCGCSLWPVPAGGELPPGRLPAGDRLDAKCAGARPVGRSGRRARWRRAGRRRSSRPGPQSPPLRPYRRALAAVGDGLGTLRLAVARAMVAEALAEQADRDGVDTPVMPDAAARDRLVLATGGCPRRW